uniref:Integral membrane bound transporter domain-containing protein n=1 Tax=Ditylum brightwellii TaxID=49249 RepID=A0A7S4RJA5_9STRA
MDSIHRKSSTSVDIDIEEGSEHHEETLQQQSRRLSQIIKSRTELYQLKKDTPTTQSNEMSEKEETSGIRYMLKEVATAKEHGGDYKQRSLTALRTSIGSFVTFAVLVYPQQEVLGAVWIANIFMHSTINTSFGSSFGSVLGFGRSIILTTACSWPVAFFINSLSTKDASIILPFLVFILTFLIMSCPPLVSRNLMILVMYIVVASPVREDMIWWKPFSWVATYLIGIMVALLSNIIPFPNFVLKSTHKKLQKFENDFAMLLLETKAYSENTAITPALSIAARASIELLQSRICSTIKELKADLPATRTELEIRCKKKASKALSDWVIDCQDLLTPLRMLRNALAQRLLGEEYDVYSPHLREAKKIINEEVGSSRDRLADAMIAAIAVCHAHADPNSHRTVLPHLTPELDFALKECRQSFHWAIAKAAKKLGVNPQSTSPIFAHLTRRMAAFNALFDIGDILLAHLKKYSWELESFNEEAKQGPCNCITSMYHTHLKMRWSPWLWHKPDSYRLALKTSVGMSIASLFISIPYLWRISQPFGVWPGLTIASVNLVTTGSSFSKAGDRLFGTMLAAAYALLVTDLFPGNSDLVKIPALTMFTFILIYLRGNKHAYANTYAATSIGSMFYGSVKNDFDFDGYIPKRIELIFAGVVIFSLVEFLLFPRSSRKVVEETSFQFFLTMNSFLKQAVKCTKLMETYVCELGKSSSSDYAAELFRNSIDPFHLDKLSEYHDMLQIQSSKLKKEIDSSIEEPHVGLSTPLHPESFRGIVREQFNSEIQAFILIDSLKELAGHYQQEGHPAREFNWPHFHTELLQGISETLDYICKWLETTFPDGRLRPQNGNSMKAITAAASFRSLEDVRLQSISKWSNNFQQFLSVEGFDTSDPEAIMTLGITTDCLLELCLRMQKAGRHVEEIVHHFPSTN